MKAHAVLVLMLVVGGSALAQEESVRPGFNEFWEKPDMEKAVDLLERKHPTIFKYRYAIVAALGLQPGAAVADVGAGTGFIATLLAQEVAPGGVVYAQDISQEALDHILKQAAEQGITNIEPVLGGHRSTKLAADSVDAIVTIRVYHHFEYPAKMLASIKAALRPNGRFVVIDHERIKGISSDWQYEHWRAGKGAFTDEILDAGFVLEKELPLLPEHYFMVFRER